MTLLPRGLKVHLALGYTDMRKGIDGLAMLVQAVLRQDPFSGHLFVFRGRKANLIKIVFWDGTGLCLFTKRLEQGVHQLVRDFAAQVADDRSELAQAQAEIERLKLIIRRFQRAQFGRRSERIDGDQLALGLEVSM